MSKAHLAPEAPLAALVLELTGRRSLPELVRLARYRRKRVEMTVTNDDNEQQLKAIDGQDDTTLPLAP